MVSVHSTKTLTKTAFQGLSYNHEHVPLFLPTGTLSPGGQRSGFIDPGGHLGSVPALVVEALRDHRLRMSIGRDTLIDEANITAANSDHASGQSVLAAPASIDRQIP